MDRTSLNLVTQAEKPRPEWTALSYKKCPNCPLEETLHKHCPVAYNLVEVIDFFKEVLSYEEVDLVIESEDRGYFKKVSVQRALSPLLGLHMVTSGCPHLDKLKPLARYHLPFAHMEETQFRLLSMYLLAQFFLKRSGQSPDWDLKEIPRIFEEVRTVNRSFAKRLHTVLSEDAVANAIVILNNFADSIIYTLSENDLSRIQEIFKAYLPGCQDTNFLSNSKKQV